MQRVLKVEARAIADEAMVLSSRRKLKTVPQNLSN